jgi:hypothetical protein
VTCSTPELRSGEHVIDLVVANHTGPCRRGTRDLRSVARHQASGPGAVASGLLGGLAAVGAHAPGAGDAYNEKLKAEAIATQARRKALQNRFAQQAEVSKALSDRGRALMSLGQAKGCPGLVYRP